MNRTIRTAFFAALLGGAAFLAMAPASLPAIAAEAPEGVDDEISDDVAELYSDAVEAFQDDMDFPAAHALLAEALALPELSPWEIYTISILDFQLFLQEQNLEQAAVRFNAAYDTGVLPQEDKERFLRIATLLNQQDHARAIMYGTEAVNYPGWDDPADQVVANAYYFSGDMPGAEQYALSVVARKEAAGLPPTVEVLTVLQAAQQEQGKTAEAAETAGRIAVVAPTPENWTRVIDGAFQTPNLSDRQGLNLYRLRDAVGAMTGADYASAAQIALLAGLPAEAKTLVDAGISGGTLAATDVANLTAEIDPSVAQSEQTLGEFATEATSAASGDIGVQYGEVLYSFGRLPEAEAAIRAGIQKGNLTTPGEAEILLGIVLLEQGRKDEALQAFQQAEQMGNPATQPVARVWRLYASV